MEIFQIILGRYFIELIGASIRYSINYISAQFTGNDYLPFASYWNMKRGDYYQKLETETGNRIVGLIFLVLLLIIVVRLPHANIAAKNPAISISCGFENP